MHLRRVRKEAEVGAVPRSSACLNCAAPLDPGHNFCPGCGQDTGTSRVAVGDLLREAWAEFVQIDSRLMRTLAALLFRPGLLTREYLDGKRVRYLSPFKMYLVVAALFFAFASWVGGVQAERAAHDASAALAPPASVHPKAGVAVDGGGRRAGRRRGAVHLAAVDGGQMDFDGLPDTVTAYETRQSSLAPAARDSGVQRFVAERAIHIRNLWRESRSGLVAAVIGYFPGMMFILLPLYALLLKLLFLRSDWLYVEHLVFSLHAHTLFFLICGLSLALSLPASESLLGRWGLAGPMTALLWLAFAIYGYAAARRVYRQGIAKTFFKGVLLTGAYLAIVTIAVTATVLYALARV